MSVRREGVKPHGNKGASHRCKNCHHKPGLRVVSATLKTSGGAKIAAPREHKKFCGCACHLEAMAV